MRAQLKTGFFETHIAPAPPLRRHVDRYTVITPDREAAGPLPWRILPEGSSHLLLHVFRDERPPQLGFVGPRSVFADIDRRGREFSLAVKFKPAGATPFLRLPMAELSDRSLPIEELWPSDGAGLRDRMRESLDRRDLPGCLAAIETALLRRMHRKPLHRLVDAAADLIERAGGCTTVRELAAKLGVTERHLRSVMSRHVGLGPKRLARITRVTDTLRKAEQHARRQWAALAAAGGYWDQSHMIDDFRALLGESPEAFLTRPNREKAPSVPFLPRRGQT